MAQIKRKYNANANGSRTLSKYLSEINNERMLSEFEEIELAKRIKSGDKAACDELIKSNLRFVISIAKQYNGRGLSLDDLINEGNIGLIKAVKKYDESKGIKFISYAVWWIRQSISQALADIVRLSRLPVNKVGNLNRFVIARNRLYQKFRREPTLNELCSELKISLKELNSIIDTYKFPLYADSAPREDDNYSFVDILADENDTYLTEKRDSVSFNDEINKVLTELSDVEGEVVRCFFGLPPYDYDAKTLEEIGSILGLTRERVRQIKEKAVTIMKKRKNSDRLRAYINKNFYVG